MSYIDDIAYNRGIRGEEPNKDLAARLAEEESREGIREIAFHLRDKNSSISSDCMAVLYHIGYLKPQLITEYADEFISLVRKSNNRMTWGSMIALATIAPLLPKRIFAEKELILERIRTGSVITNIWGVKVLVELARADSLYYADLAPALLELQRQCRPVDFPKRAMEIAPILQGSHRQEFFEILETGLPDQSKTGALKVQKLMKTMESPGKEISRD